MEFIQAIVESYDQANHRANVRPLAHPASLLVAIPVSSDCPGELMKADERVLVVSWPDAGAVIIGPYESRPIYPVFASMESTTQRAFTSTSYTLWPGSQLSLTTLVKSRFWVHCSFNLRKTAVTNLGYYVRIYANGGQRQPLVAGSSSNNDYWYPVALSGVISTTFNPGTHTVEVRLRVYGTGTVYGTNISLAVQAFPCA